jgi:hypothetical protein
MTAQEIAVGLVSDHVDRLWSANWQACEADLVADGWSADEVAHARQVLEVAWLIAKMDTLERVRTWLTACTTVH